jgi:hypothetical protein
MTVSGLEFNLGTAASERTVRSEPTRAANGHKLPAKPMSGSDRHSGLTGPLRNILRNFARRFPEKNDESNPGEVCNSVSARFFCMLMAGIRGFTTTVSD